MKVEQLIQLVADAAVDVAIDAMLETGETLSDGARAALRDQAARVCHAAIYTPMWIELEVNKP